METYNSNFVNESNMNRQQATVTIDLAELMRAYVAGCKEMFELGKAAAELGQLSNQQAQQLLMGPIGDEERSGV